MKEVKIGWRTTEREPKLNFPGEYSKCVSPEVGGESWVYSRQRLEEVVHCEGGTIRTCVLEVTVKILVSLEFSRKTSKRF